MKENLSDIIDRAIEILSKIWEFVTTPIFDLGSNGISLGTLFYFLFAFVILIWISSRLRSIINRLMINRLGMEQAAVGTISTVARFSVLLLGSIIIIQSAGIDLSALSLLAGALGVGIGFGLQNITDNFISGIIILFENPIKVGDRIEVGNVQGDVINISFRATTVLTNDNISIIVPNSDFISKTVINWSHNDRNIRFRLPVGVSYNEDPAIIKQILLDVAEKNEHVLSKPVPKVLFTGYGDSSIDFELAVWTASHTDKPFILKSELYFSIFEVFKEKGIEIPFPQRDLHIRSDATK